MSHSKPARAVRTSSAERQVTQVGGSWACALTTARSTRKGEEAWRRARRGCERGITNLAACQGVKDAAHVRRGNHTASARVVVGRTCRCKS